MEFYQLEVFIAVAEEGSFSRAAERVFRTQSAVSQAVKKLEDELGLLLLDRETATLVPTEAGQAVLDYARRTIAMRDQCLQLTDSLKRARTGKVTIAAFESAALYILPEPLRAFHERFPDIEIEVLRRPDETIPHQVLERSADIGFVTSESPFHDLCSFKLFDDPLILIVPPGHRLAGRRDAMVEHLANEHFFVHHVRTQTTQKVIGLFEEHRTDLRIAARLWSYENVKEFVKGGAGVAIVPAISARTELRERTLVEVPLAGLDSYRTIRVIHSKEQYLPAAARELLGVIKTWRWPSLTRPGPPAKDDPGRPSARSPRRSR